jgi:hypothetical protein
MKSMIAVIAAAALSMIAAPMAGAQGAFELKGGFSYGRVSNQGILPGDVGSRTGFAVGVAARTGGPLVAIGAEGLYAQRGVDSRELDYVDVPVYVRASLPVPVVTPFAYAGPQLSFELQCQAGGVDCPEGDRAKTTYAAVIGAGAQLGVGKGVSIEGRYIYGLSDLDLETVTSAENYQTRSFMILAGIAF